MATHKRAESARKNAARDVERGARSRVCFFACVSVNRKDRLSSSLAGEKRERERCSRGELSRMSLRKMCRFRERVFVTR